MVMVTVTVMVMVMVIGIVTGMLWSVGRLVDLTVEGGGTRKALHACNATKS